jgi:ribosomal protein S27E
LSKKKNPIAKYLKDRRYRQIVIKNITAEIVNGKCPTCDEFTMLVGLTATVYRCMNCGSDLEQHVNGKISYLPHITRSGDAEPYVREWKDGEKV